MIGIGDTPTQNEIATDMQIKQEIDKTEESFQNLLQTLNGREISKEEFESKINGLSDQFKSLAYNELEELDDSFSNIVIQNDNCITFKVDINWGENIPQSKDGKTFCDIPAMDPHRDDHAVAYNIKKFDDEHIWFTQGGYEYGLVYLVKVETLDTVNFVPDATQRIFIKDSLDGKYYLAAGNYAYTPEISENSLIYKDTTILLILYGYHIISVFDLGEDGTILEINNHTPFYGSFSKEDSRYVQFNITNLFHLNKFGSEMVN